MNKKLLAISIALALTSVSGILHAEGNISAGKAKAASCAGCHGEDGNSAIPMYPKLAEQHSTYISKELLAFKTSARKDPTMEAMVQALSDDDMKNIGAYYASQKISANPAPQLVNDDDDEAEEEVTPVDLETQLAELLALGSDLYRNGDVPREVSACIACHGPYGEGNKPATYPALKGQHADYLIKTLADFKAGNRTKNPDNAMHMIAKKMTDKEIKAVAYHISTMK